MSDGFSNTSSDATKATNASDILFKADIFDCNETSSNDIKPRKLCQGHLNGQPQAQDLGELLRPVAMSRPPKPPVKNDHHVTFQARRPLSSLHPAFRKRPVSGRPGDVDPLDHQIISHGGTTSTYEQLPNQLQIAKENNAKSPAERVLELTRKNGYLLQELAYSKDVQDADLTFYQTMVDLQGQMKDALKKRLQKRQDAETSLLNYWGIEFGDGNVEEVVF